MSQGIANHGGPGVVVFGGADVSMVAPACMPSCWEMNAEVVHARSRQIPNRVRAARASRGLAQTRLGSRRVVTVLSFARMMPIRARVIDGRAESRARVRGRGAVSVLAAGFQRMPYGKQWTTENLNVTTERSYCYENSEQNCRRYGRLYTWESAQQACRALGGGWRLPTNEEWRQLAKPLRRHPPGVGRSRHGGIHGAHRRRKLRVQRREWGRAHRQERRSTCGSTATDSTGQPPRPVRTRPGSTTSVKARSR